MKQRLCYWGTIGVGLAFILGASLDNPVLMFGALAAYLIGVAVWGFS